MIPINFVIIEGRMCDNRFPKEIERLVITNEIPNKINLEREEILVFLSPYVIPIPNESMLTEIAKESKLNSMFITSVHNM